MLQIHYPYKTISSGGDGMKKLFFIFFAAILLMVGCNQDKNTEPVDQKAIESSKSEKDENKSIEVDKKLLNVEVTIPATFFEGEEIEQIIAEAKEDGIKEVVQNDDGSITYKMSKADHKKMLKDMENDINSTIEDITTNEDFTSIQDIKANKNFSEFTMVVDQEAFENSFDGFAALSLAFSGMFYQLFNGVAPDDYAVTVHIEDATSGEVFDSIIYPDALQD